MSAGASGPPMPPSIEQLAKRLADLERHAVKHNEILVALNRELRKPLATPNYLTQALFDALVARSLVDRDEVMAEYERLHSRYAATMKTLLDIREDLRRKSRRELGTSPGEDIPPDDRERG